MNQLYIFLLVLWSAVSSSDAWEEYENTKDIPEPIITVYRQQEDGEVVFVLCKFTSVPGRRYRRQSFKLSVESELNYTMETFSNPSLDSSEMRAYMVTVSPPASFTCVHEVDFYVDVRNVSSQAYNYSVSGVSSLYACFSSFIAVALFIMTAAVIVTNIRSKTKDTDSTAVTDNDHVEAGDGGGNDDGGGDDYGCGDDVVVMVAMMMVMVMVMVAVMMLMVAVMMLMVVMAVMMMLVVVMMVAMMVMMVAMMVMMVAVMMMLAVVKMMMMIGVVLVVMMMVAVMMMIAEWCWR
ncbi:uncharacterized protein LOC122350659 [Puntigrus tetrazona]|uniref:uncharacterized protein LOC122350659 n=1 Tax=Puntigrus tetrazona TaxID=1606681 RepID=UPI001C8955A8|nr:uncharacterized protein LOC122350659 [Puntigrus tetrazona]